MTRSNIVCLSQWSWAGLLVSTTVLMGGCNAALGTNPTSPAGSGGSAMGGAGQGQAGGGGHTGSTGGQGGGAGSGTSGSAGAGPSGGSSGTGGAVASGPCSATVTAVVLPRRLVRLTFGQVVNSIRNLVDATVATSAQTIAQVPPPTKRGFPPLFTGSEGNILTDQVWEKGDRIADMVGRYVADHTATIGTCGAAPTEACAQTLVLSLAEKAYRRPLNTTEQNSLKQVLTDVKTAGGLPREQVQYGVYAVLESPQFLYRAEFGAAPGAAGAAVPLTPYEMASQISYFLTDAPPDQPLLDAAKAGTLSTAAQILSQVDRLAAGPVARTNLQTAIFAYFQIYNLDTIAIDATKYPVFTSGIKNAMYTESEQFINNVLWNGKLNDVITSRTTFVNTDLARDIYKLPAPAGATQTNFVAMELPADRAGMLTQPALLTARARPDGQSVVGRGLLVNSTMMCAVNPGFPAALADVIEATNMMQVNLTERQKAEYRADLTSGRPCGGCHRSFDPYGLVLDTFDVVGRARTADDMGRPIDTNVTLPPFAGGAMVSNAADFAKQIADNGKFAGCMTRNMMNFALADGQTQESDCSVRSVVDKFRAGSDQTFTGLLREIAVSKTLGTRIGGN